MLVQFYPEDETLIWLALSRIPGLGRRMITTLLECFEGPQLILEATEAQLASFSKMTPDLLNAIRAVDITTVKSELDSLTAGDIRLVHWRHPDYPANLRHSPDGPIVLRIKGQLAVEDSNAVAIVGTTSPTSEARALARLLGEKLATEGLTIVSGLAKGIDSEAHRGALEAAGRTLGILGCGLDRIFPPENRGLAAEVVESGALLSEMPLGVPATGRRLMARNRITSGMAKATIVVESEKDSGSLATARRAKRQGRLVYAVDNGRPGNSELLAEGAQPIPANGQIEFGALARHIVAHELQLLTADNQLDFDFE